MTSQNNSNSNANGGRTPPSLFTLVLMAGSAVMVMNIFLPMQTQIGNNLGASPAVTQYVLTLFLATTAVAQLFVGPMADRYGRRPVLLTTSIIFIIGSLICVFATSIEMLLAGRVLQASSAASIALSRAIIRDLYDRSKSASMIGYVTMAMAIIPMMSPSLGGYTGELYGWRAPFVILLMVGIAMLLIIYFDLGETFEPTEASFRERVQDYFSLLKEPMVWGYLLCSSASSGAYFAFLGGAPFVGTEIIGITPSTLGFYFAFVATGYMVGNFLSGRYSERVGIEPMMICGGLVACTGVLLSLYLMTNFTPKAEYLFYPMMLVGMGNGMTLPNSNAGAISVRPDLAGSASGLGGFLQIGGGAALAALSGVLISVENQALPLYIIMAASSIVGASIAALMFFKMRKQGL